MGEIKKNPWIAEWLRSKGLKVVEHDGWQDRSRPESSGSFNPQGVMVHHDASPNGPSPSLPAYCIKGRPPLTPGPLCHFWVAYDGTWHVLAAGRANHAGLGGAGEAANSSASWIPKNSGNAYTYGIEVDHTTGETWPKAQYESLVKGVAALMLLLGKSNADRVTSHKEYAPGRKTDPHGINMNVFRSQVERAMATAQSKPRPPVKPKPKPNVPKPREIVDLSNVRPMKRNADVAVVQKALIKLGFHIPLIEQGKAKPGLFAEQTRRAYAAFQRSLGYKGRDADGVPGMQSLTKLGLKADFRVVR